MKKYKVLVVEDEEGPRKKLERLFLNEVKDRIQEYRLASSGAAAAKCLAEEKFDVTILDIKLGDTTAYNLVRSFRSNIDQFGSIVLMTALENVETDFILTIQPLIGLPKPFDEYDLRSMFLELDRKNTGAKSERLQVKTDKGEIVIIEMDDIFYAESAKGGSHSHFVGKNSKTSEPIDIECTQPNWKAFKQIMNPKKFCFARDTIAINVYKYTGLHVGDREVRFSDPNIRCAYAAAREASILEAVMNR